MTHTHTHTHTITHNFLSVKTHEMMQYVYWSMCAASGQFLGPADPVPNNNPIFIFNPADPDPQYA